MVRRFLSLLRGPLLSKGKKGGYMPRGVSEFFLPPDAHNPLKPSPDISAVNYFSKLDHLLKPFPADDPQACIAAYSKGQYHLDRALRVPSTETLRKRYGVIYAEGERVVETGLIFGWEPRLIFSPLQLVKRFQDLLAQNGFKKTVIFPCSSREVAQKFMFTSRLDPVLAIGPYPLSSYPDVSRKRDEATKNPPSNPDEDSIPSRSIVVATQDPTNLGSILRTSAAYGLKDVVLHPESPCAFNPLVLRSSSGASFGLRFRSQDILLRALASPKVKLIVSEAHGGCQVPSPPPSNFVLVFGHETKGCPSELASHPSAVKVTLPISGMESLNVGAAAAILIDRLLGR